MTPASAVEMLNRFLATYGENIILRRITGTAPNQISVDVTCRARVDAMSDTQLAAGIASNELNVIISPTQIINVQWPGSQSSTLPPFNVDARLPRAGQTDKVLMRGQQPRAVTFVDAKFMNGVWVRANLRVAG